MTGTYKIDENRVSMMKGAELFSRIRVMLILFSIFLLAALLRKDQDVFTYFIMIGTFLVIVLLVVVMSFLKDAPWYNTEIVVTEHGITRRGQGLRTIELKFADISHAKNWKIGVLFFEKGIGSRLNYYTSQHVLTNSTGILFVPLAIERYDDLVAHIKLKSNVR
jgi:Na+/melibiose symporter-like transporter